MLTNYSKKLNEIKKKLRETVKHVVRAPMTKENTAAMAAKQASYGYFT